MDFIPWDSFFTSLTQANTEILHFAESISKFGSGLFLLVQVVLLLDFVHGWNDKWVGFDEQFWLVLAFVISFSISSLLPLIAFCLLIEYIFTPLNQIYLLYSYRYVALFVVSLVCYVGTFVFSGFLFYWFTPSGQDCGLNTFFIVMTLIFAFLFAIVALHPAVSYTYVFWYSVSRHPQMQVFLYISCLSCLLHILSYCGSFSFDVYSAEFVIMMFR